MHGSKTEKDQKLTELVKAYLTEQDLTKEVEAEKEAIRTLIDKMPNSNLPSRDGALARQKNVLTIRSGKNFPMPA